MDRDEQKADEVSKFALAVIDVADHLSFDEAVDLVRPRIHLIRNSVLDEVKSRYDSEIRSIDGRPMVPAGALDAMMLIMRS